jgi:hypothetical protein
LLVGLLDPYHGFVVCPNIHPITKKLWLAGLLVGYCFLTSLSPVLADGFILRASVPAKASDFQLELATSRPDPILPNTQIIYTITYGWLLQHPTDIMVIQVQWGQGLEQPNLGLTYMEGSATSAGQFAAQIDTTNRTITWNISPVTPGANQQVRFGLRAGSVATVSPIPFTIQARIIGPGITLPWQYLEQHYQSALALTPSSTPKPSTPISGTAGGYVKPSSQVGRTVWPGFERLQTIAQNGGRWVALLLIALAILPWLLTLLTSIFSILPNLGWWQLLSLAGILFWRRPRHPWGVVYDAKSKLPLDPVLLTLTDSYGQEFRTVSDMYGRYEFDVEAGQYTLQAIKDHYQFPSSLLQLAEFDEIYQDLYYGQTIMVQEDGDVSYNVPMDPSVSWSQISQPLPPWEADYWRYISLFIFGLGFLWSTVMAALYPSWINISIVCLYVGFVASIVFYRWQHPWGIVTNSDHQPIGGAVVTLDNLKHPQLAPPPVVTAPSGRYAFPVDKGFYRLRVAIRRPGGQLRPVTSTPPINQADGYVARDITLPPDKQP